MAHSQTPNKRKRMLLPDLEPVIDPQLLLPDSKRNRVDEAHLPVFRFNDEEIVQPVSSKMEDFYALNEPTRKMEAGRLSTTCLRTGRPQVIVLVVSKERFTIGRREKNNYPLPEQPETLSVSGYHAELHAVGQTLSCFEHVLMVCSSSNRTRKKSSLAMKTLARLVL